MNQSITTAKGVMSTVMFSNIYRQLAQARESPEGAPLGRGKNLVSLRILCGLCVSAVKIEPGNPGVPYMVTRPGRNVVKSEP
jgi:hypothetical protein